MVADFNGDGKPDVFFACTGHDVSPPPGENPRILLSQPDGTYSNTEIPNLVGFHHGGSAADLNGDGKPDVI
ncbi:MAG: VCBS repeat-containing protein [Gemmatimonadaceae bacterium]|nr:VCBS repeat-containing protein [Gemmatimonadaceae bacterium]